MDESTEGEVMISFPTLNPKTSAVRPESRCETVEMEGGGGNAQEKDDNKSEVGLRDSSTSFPETLAVRPMWQRETREKEGGGEATWSERRTKGRSKMKDNPMGLLTVNSETFCRQT